MGKHAHDDLDRWLATKADDSEFQAGREDAAELLDLIEALRALREKAGLSQTEVARAMGTSQSAVSVLERGETDPQIRTVMKYARAVGARLKFDLDETKGDVHDEDEDHAYTDVYQLIDEWRRQMHADTEKEQIRAQRRAQPRSDRVPVFELAGPWLPIVTESARFKANDYVIERTASRRVARAHVR